MAEWTVELAADFAAGLKRWDENAQLEFYAIFRRLQQRGPEGIRLVASELEGVPAWDQLGQPMERTVPILMPSGVWGITLDILPERRLIILSATHTRRH